MCTAASAYASMSYNLGRSDACRHRRAAAQSSWVSPAPAPWQGQDRVKHTLSAQRCCLTPQNTRRSGALCCRQAAVGHRILCGMAGRGQKFAGLGVNL